MSNISLNYAQIIDPLSFKSINLAKIYIGEYGTLPNPANASTWKQAYFVNPDGTRTAASQPIRTNAAGFAVDGSGNIKTIQVDGGYSLLVQDQLNVTKFSQACSPANDGAVLEFDTIAGFTGALDGSVCYFKGRDTVGDGGGGYLRFLAGSTATANGVTIYAVTGGRLVREGFSYPSVLWAGADGVGDDTAAFTLAQAAASYIEVPAGYTFKVGPGLDYWKFFGAGTVIENGREWQLSRSPQTAYTQKVYRQTYGTFESAAGSSVVINNPNGQQQIQTEVLGVTTQGVAQYGGFDHVAVFAAAYSYASPIISGAGATYTATTITQSGISAMAIKAGMLVRTNHSPWYVGKVQSVSGNTITVDAWYTQSTGVATTPTNGVGAILNPNYKIWVNNSNLHLMSGGDATSGTGFELGLLLDKTGVGANSVGFDAVGLSGEDAFAHFRSRSRTSRGFYSEDATEAGFKSVQSPVLGGNRYGFWSVGGKAGFVASDCGGAALLVEKAGVQHMSVNGGGEVTRMRYKTADYGTGATISPDVTFAVCVGTSVTLPAIRGDGQVIIVSNQTGGNLTVNGGGANISGSPTATLTSLTGLALVAFQGNWVKTIL